jgi:hypothetical protein
MCLELKVLQLILHLQSVARIHPMFEQVWSKFMFYAKNRFHFIFWLKTRKLKFYGGCELLYALSDLRFIIILDSGRGMSFERIAILKQIIPVLTVTESILRTEEINNKFALRQNQ